MKTNFTTVFIALVLAVVAVPTSSLIVRRHAIPQGGPPDPECRPKGPPGSEPQCCKIPGLFEGKDDIIESCIKEVQENPNFQLGPPPNGGDGHPPPPPPPGADKRGPPPHFPCVEECIFNKTGLNADGKLNKDAVKKAVTEVFSSAASWTPLAIGAFEKCSSLPEVDKNKKCLSGAMEFNKCFFTELFLSCPPDQWTDSDECTKKKEQVIKCSKNRP